MKQPDSQNLSDKNRMNLVADTSPVGESGADSEMPKHDKIPAPDQPNPPSVEESSSWFGWLTLGPIEHAFSFARKLSRLRNYVSADVMQENRIDDEGTDLIGTDPIGHWAFRNVITPFVFNGTPIAIILLILWLVVVSFWRGGTWNGVFALTGIMIPLIAVSGLYFFRNEILLKILRITNLGAFVISFISGFIVMAIVTFSSRTLSMWIACIPLSGALSFLIVGRVFGGHKQVMAWYYGFVLGLLIFVITVLPWAT